MTLCIGGATRRSALTFAVGATIGFLVAYTVLLSSRGKGLPWEEATKARQLLVQPGHFIPSDPHSHGEMDELQGPDKEQTWQDFEEDNHHNHGRFSNELR